MRKQQFVRRFFQIYKPFGKTFAAAVVIIAIASALALLPPYLQGRVVDAQKLGLYSKTILFIVLTGFMLFTMGLVGIGRGIFENRYLDLKLDRFGARLMLDKVFQFSIGQHLNQNSGITQSIVSKGKHSMNTLVFTLLFEALPTAAEICVVSTMLLIMAPLLGLVMVSGILIFAANRMYMNYRLCGPLRELDEMEHRLQKHENEVLRNAGLVIASAQEKRAIEEYDAQFERIQIVAVSLWDKHMKGWILPEAVLAATWISASLVTAHFVQTGRYTIGFMVMVWWWFFRIQNSASRIGWIFRQIMKVYPSVAKYFELLDLESDVKVLPNPVKPEKFEGRIEFRNVTMRYRVRPYIVNEEEVEPQVLSRDPALSGVSFTVNSGERVAIVGESGAGKTTIMHALLRVQDPDEGQVLVDGHDLRLLDIKQFREALGIVEQPVALFDHSLRYNITYGLNGRSKLVTEEELADIAKMACMDRFVKNLTNGFDTAIGERGIRLSGGERQRVGIARALIKRPSILIFDEATSNLDPQNELLIREAIERASIGRTTIIIAHRFSTIRNVDKVIVMDQGKIVGIGPHDELARTCEYYQRLIKPQV